MVCPSERAISAPVIEREPPVARSKRSQLMISPPLKLRSNLRCALKRDCRCANLQRDSKILDRKNAPKQPALMNSLNRFADPVYCIMRFIAGLMFACHGAQLVLGKFGGMPGSDKPIMVIGGWIQLIG